jgi:tRNA pseudouridine55 synthase
LKTKRVGHTGTLDPFATGVLVILIGKATRLARFLDKDEKEYEAVVRFGFETDTGDCTGSPKSQVSGLKRIAVDDIETALESFRGEIEQIPPMYSAKKIGGKKLYELARKGEMIERKPVSVTIHKLELMEPHGSVQSVTLPPEEAWPKARVVGAAGGLMQTFDTVAFRVSCSAGTYIRTLAEDIGRAVGTGAHLIELRRMRAGRFDLSQSLTLADLENLENPQAALIPIEDAVPHLPKIVLDGERVEKTKNGLSTRIHGREFIDDQLVQMVDEAGNLIAVGFYNEREKAVQPKVVLI